MLSSPILTTKLYIPSPRAVPRPRLIEHLNAGLHRKLTVISAPAGFGKTTLASEWVNGLTKNEIRDGKHEIRNGENLTKASLGKNRQSKIENRVAWLSLDKRDNDLGRFLTYLVAALQTADPQIGQSALALHQSSQPPPIESILTVLLNDMSAIEGNVVLVLDDYHVIEEPAAHDALTFLLEHWPSQMHLAITTREEPPLPLARMRVRGQLTEVRGPDLRFTLDEAAHFLNQMMGLNLSSAEIANLESRTEGWIAGLQLAALALQGQLSRRGQKDNFIDAFTGSHRFVLAYLVEEVLQVQPDLIRDFLLQTAILERVSGPLSNALTGQENGQKMLENLERGNLFIIPLDDQDQWYRYHHLFADALQAQLVKEQPDLLPTLHVRACDWYEQNHFLADAIRHALAARDFERAAGLLELIWPELDESFLTATWLGWVKSLPAELLRKRPVLTVHFATALLTAGELEAGEAQLREGERWLEAAVGENERSLPVKIAAARAYLAQALGDMPGTVKYARQALELLPEDDFSSRAIPASLLGLACWASGDLEAAQLALSEVKATFQRAGRAYEGIDIDYVLADILIARGHLDEALTTYHHALQLAAAQGDPPLQGTANLYVGLSELHRERGDLETAEKHLRKSEDLGERAALPDWRYRLCIAHARIKEARGNLGDAFALLDEAEHHFHRNPLPDVRPLAALKARMWTAQGRLTEALRWARERGLTTADDLNYLQEYEHITLARVLITRYRSEQKGDAIFEIREFLQRLLEAAEEGGRGGSIIEILMLQAITYEAQGNLTPALPFLERALFLAEPQGYVRIFVDEGPPMKKLLQEAAKRDSIPPYANQLLAHFGNEKGNTTAAQPLIDPLSERELEVLKLLESELNGPEIARELMISLNTMRTHTKNIYHKLGVNSRRAAVRRAAELDLL
ncbi:MAG: tetratricopeptide repeat protein [Ardenticatenaceae bacterium]|nr:tetratricopeptide repeat protein [Ardenticatenaceae bacterium]